MRNIAIFTTTRAEYGILKPLINAIKKESDFKLFLFVGGTHMVVEFGKTIEEVKKDGCEINDTFDFFLNENSDFALTKSVGIEIIELAHIFHKYPIDLVCLVGDRYELLGIVTAAILFVKPIIHIHGGEKTEGLIDEQVRHMITKASHIHFPSCEEYAKNIENMGEAKWRIHNVGALAVDNIVSLPKVSKEDLFKLLRLKVDKATILMTYHPVTLEFGISPLEQIKNIFGALNIFDFQVVITAPNADKDRDIIFDYINNQVISKPDYIYVESLGVKNYLSLIPFCNFVIGNSSSALIEVPFFRIPVINIGNRQKGRIEHENVITCNYDVDSITAAIRNAIEPEFTNQLKNMIYRFGNGSTAEKMVEIIRDIEINEQLFRKQLVFPY